MNDRFLRACRREPVDRTPVWFMRQAGRYLPEYRELREARDVLELGRSPELVVEATLQPLRRMQVDAAILFSDIMVPLAAIGVGVSIDAGIGPVVAEPFRSNADVDRLRPLEPDVDVPFVAASATPPPLASTRPAATTANVLFGLISPPFIALMAMPPATATEKVKRA